VTVVPLLTVAPEVVLHRTMNTEVAVIGGVDVLPFEGPMPSEILPCSKMLHAVVIVLDQESLVVPPAETVLGSACSETVGVGLETDGCVVGDDCAGDWLSNCMSKLLIICMNELNMELKPPP
jgi:hypothetical protein